MCLRARQRTAAVRADVDFRGAGASLLPDGRPKIGGAFPALGVELTRGRPAISPRTARRCVAAARSLHQAFDVEPH